MAQAETGSQCNHTFIIYSLDESVRIVEAVARLIAAEIHEMEDNMDTYPTRSDLTDDNNNNKYALHPMLKVLLESIIHLSFISYHISLYGLCEKSELYVHFIILLLCTIH